MAPTCAAGSSRSSSQFRLANESNYGTPSQLDRSTTAPSNRTWQTDGLNINTTDNEIRNRLIRLSYDGLVHNTTYPPRQVLYYALRLEAAACAQKGFSMSRDSAYSSKLIDVFHILKSPNHDLRLAILNGNLAPEEVVKRDSSHLRSSRRLTEDEEHMRRSAANAMASGDHYAMTCRECGTKQNIYLKSHKQAPKTLCSRCRDVWEQTLD